jgi:hypothetical protein
MALNMEKVNAFRNKLASKAGKKLTESQQERVEKIKKYIWKPEPGKQVVRIVPYQYSPDFPFIELKWHYDFNGDKVSYLSPASVNKADPIVELAQRLEKVRETWVKGRKMQPKLRTYVPIIVRGKEEEGVKFWGFGKRVCDQLTAAISEPDYGDITDLNNGYDITVDFKTAEELNADFPDTKILIKPKPRPVIDPEHPKAKEIMELITKKQPNIYDIYEPASYEELAAALEIKLESERRGTNVGSSPRGAERTTSASTETIEPVDTDDSSGDDTVVLPTEEEIAAHTPPAPIAEVVAATPAKPVVSPSAQKAKKASVQDFEAAFKDIFPEKKS